MNVILKIQKYLTKIFIIFFLLLPVLIFAEELRVPDFSELLRQRAGGTLDEQGMLDFRDNILAEIETEILVNSIVVTTQPQFPGPFEDVSIKIESSGFDIMRSNISWYVNNKLFSKQVGLNTLTFKIGKTGDISKIKIKIISSDGESFTKNVSVMPMEMEFLWEADTYTPPFYKGKALLSPYSTVKIVAQPKIKSKNGKGVNKDSLVYLWKGNGRKVFSDSSGFGKNILYTQAPRPFYEEFISVEISSLDNSIKSGGRMKLELAEPKILFYEENPIEGIKYENAISDRFDLSEQELAVVAEPYFFARGDKESGNLTFDWSLNGSSVVGEKGHIVFRQEGKGGEVSVALSVKNIARRFQNISERFMLNFKGIERF